RTFEALLNAPLQLFHGLLGRSGWHSGQTGEPCRMSSHCVGQIVVGVARHGDGVGRFHLFDAGRRQRQHLHVDAGGIHFRQPFGVEVAEPIEHLEITVADFFGALFDETRRTIEKLRGGEMLFKRDRAHAWTFYWTFHWDASSDRNWRDRSGVTDGAVYRI